MNKLKTLTYHIKMRLQSMPGMYALALMLSFTTLPLGAQVIVDAPCAIGILTFDLNTGMSPDVSGRNVYTNDSMQAHIQYNTLLTRWEVISYGPEEFVYYATAANTFAPNPPNSTVYAYPLMIVGEGCLDEGPATVTGPGTQDMMGDDPCFLFGGDADGDGICNFYDICSLGDDNLDMDGDGIPDACDAEPAIPNRTVNVLALCLSPDPLIFLLEGMDGTGRNIYSNDLAQLEIRFNSGLARWEIKAQAPGTEVFFINTFASAPNPPDDVTSPWVSVNTVCDTTPATIGGEGTQEILIIPTLSQWGIIILGLLLLIIGFIYIKAPKTKSSYKLDNTKS